MSWKSFWCDSKTSKSLKKKVNELKKVISDMDIQIHSLESVIDDRDMELSKCGSYVDELKHEVNCLTIDLESCSNDSSGCFDLMATVNKQITKFLKENK